MSEETHNDHHELGVHLLETLQREFRSKKQLAERAFAQLRGDEWHYRADPEANSVAVIIQHLHGNMCSRWTDFLLTDGEKASRQRDAEFVEDETSLEVLMTRWEEGWGVLFATLATLTPADLLRTVTIRGQPHTALEATVGQMTHYAEHVGQIIFIVKQLRGEAWQSLSIPKAIPKAKPDTP